MTREEMMEVGNVMKAFLNGGTIQVRVRARTNQQWTDCPCPSFNFSFYTYRVKPEPKLRKWKPEEVPLGAWFRAKGDYRESLIIGRDLGCGMKIVMTTHGCEPVLRDMRCSEIEPERFEHSSDGGATWLPCGVLEVA